MRSSNDKVTLIICTNVPPKANFLDSAETLYGYNVGRIILKEPSEAIFWANFKVNINCGTSRLLLSSNKHYELVRETILFMISYSDVLDDIITFI